MTYLSNTPLETYLSKFGAKGTINRLKKIASMNLGKRSEAAKLVCKRRSRRKKLMDFGLSFDEAVLIVRQEKNYDN